MGMELDAKKIAALREKRGLSQFEAAELMNISPQNWNNLEGGRRKNVTLEVLGRLCKVLKCTCVDVVRDG